MAREDRNGEEKTADGDFIVIKLGKPIKAHGEDILEIKCRPPTAADIIQVGNPISLDFKADGTTPIVETDDARMARMISILGGIPPSSVAQMAPREFISACWKLRSFFLPE